MKLLINILSITFLLAQQPGALFGSDDNTTGRNIVVALNISRFVFLAAFCLALSYAVARIREYKKCRVLAALSFLFLTLHGGTQFLYRTGHCGEEGQMLVSLLLTLVGVLSALSVWIVPSLFATLANYVNATIDSTQEHCAAYLSGRAKKSE